MMVSRELDLIWRFLKSKKQTSGELVINDNGTFTDDEGTVLNLNDFMHLREFLPVGDDEDGDFEAAIKWAARLVSRMIERETSDLHLKKEGQLSVAELIETLNHEAAS
jgi:hypothetical protein